jgi:cell division protein FtsB
MREFHAIQKQHDNWKKVIHSKWFLLFLLVCIFFLSRGVFRIYGKYSLIQKDFNELQSDVQTLQKRDAELDVYIKRIDSPEGKDYEIRKKLDVAKPGEKTLYIVDTP